MLAGIRANVLTPLLAAILLPVAVSASTAATGATSRIVIRATGQIEGIALDGHRIAYSRGPVASHCAAILSFDVRTRKRAVVVGGGETWPACDAGTNILALAGSRVVWLTIGESNSELWGDLHTVSLPRGRKHLLASARTYFNPLPAWGSQLADLVGGRNLLVVNRWSVKKNGDLGRTVLYAVEPTRLSRIVASPGPIFAQAVDGRRIVVVRGGPPYRRHRLEIYDGHGRRQLSIGLGRLTGEYRGDGIALQGAHLLVLHGRRLLVYDSHTGALRHTWPVHVPATNLDTYGGVAVYARWTGYTETPFTLHVVRLSTGKDVAIDRGLFHTLRNLELGPSGLVYVKGKRTLVYLPLARLLAAVS